MTINGVKVDIVKYPYPFLMPELLDSGVRMADIEDIGAMKLAAVTNRGTRRDFVDLYFLLQKFSIERLFELYKAKYRDGNEMLVIRSLNYFDEADKDAEVTYMVKPVKWEMVKKTVSAAVVKYARSR